MNNEETIVYELQELEGGMATVRNSTAEFWKELKNPSSETYAEAKRLGIEPDLLPEGYEDALRMSKVAAGFDASITDLVLTFVSGAVAPMAKDAWKYILLPQLRHRFGDKALAEKKAGKKR